MQLCDLHGRDCIANKSKTEFDCETSCEGIYADIVPWFDQDPDWWTLKEMIQHLVAEYTAFKLKSVRHFKLNTSSASPYFGLFDI